MHVLVSPHSPMSTWILYGVTSTPPLLHISHFSIVILIYSFCLSILLPTPCRVSWFPLSPSFPFLLIPRRRLMPLVCHQYQTFFTSMCIIYPITSYHHYRFISSILTYLLLCRHCLVSCLTLLPHIFKKTRVDFSFNIPPTIYCYFVSQFAHFSLPTYQLVRGKCA